MAGRINQSLDLYYQVVTSLMVYEGELVWSRFNSLLTVHIVFFALGALLIKDSEGLNSSNAEIFIGGSIVGIFISVLWFEMTSRGFATLRYYTLSAREIEDKIDNSSLKILKRGRDFSNDEIIEFDFIDKKTNLKVRHQRPWYGRLIKTEYAALVTIFLIIFSYIIVIYLAAQRL